MFLELLLNGIHHKRLKGFIEIYSRDLETHSKKEIGNTFLFNYEERKTNKSDLAHGTGIYITASLEQENDNLVVCLLASLKHIVHPDTSSYKEVINLFQSASERVFLNEFRTNYAQEESTQNQNIVLETRTEIGKIKGTLKARQRLAVSNISLDWIDCTIITPEEKRFKIITNTEKRLTYIPE